MTLGALSFVKNRYELRNILQNMSTWTWLLLFFFHRIHFYPCVCSPSFRGKVSKKKNIDRLSTIRDGGRCTHIYTRVINEMNHIIKHSRLGIWILKLNIYCLNYCSWMRSESQIHHSKQNKVFENSTQFLMWIKTFSRFWQWSGREANANVKWNQNDPLMIIIVY